MQGEPFLYFLKIGEIFKFVDEYGNIKTTSTPKALQHAPLAWEEVSLMTQRSSRYFGFERSFTIPLSFVEDGARILKDAYFTNGVFAKLEVLILEQKLPLMIPHTGTIMICFT